MRTLPHFASSGDGWELSLHQTWDEATLVPGRPPVVIVPGYGMNSFIFQYHPRGASLEGHLVAAGFEVWRADLRGQGASRRTGGDDRFGLEHLALRDLPAALEAVRRATRTRHERVSLIGASLGGTLALIYTALTEATPLASLVLMGAPLRWVEVHPLLKFAFASPTIAGAIPLRGTRKLASLALPHLVKYVPSLLSIYMNPAITDTTAASELVKTVEDPSRHINREIAAWILGKDLRIGGRNVTEAARSIDLPLLCILARGDGIVPRATARLPYEIVASRDKTLLEVGTADLEMAHADMFASTESHARVFDPLSAWLAAH